MQPVSFRAPARFSRRSLSFNAEHFYPGFRPSSRHHQCAATFYSRDFPVPRYVPSLGFLNLPTVCSAPRLCRLISSHSHVQGSFSRSGGCALCAAVLPHRKSSAPMSLLTSFTHRQAGCNKRCPATSRPCSAQRSVPPVWCYPPLWPCPSSGSWLPQVIQSPCRWLRLTRSQTLMTFATRPSS
jgi:hypothetical protein